MTKNKFSCLKASRPEYPATQRHVLKWDPRQRRCGNGVMFVNIITSVSKTKITYSPSET